MESNDLFLLIVPAIFLFVGIVFLIVGLTISRHIEKLVRRCTLEVDAVVDDMRRASRGASVKSRTDLTPMLYPVFRYYYGGTEYKVQSHYASNPPKFSVGQSTTLRIDPDNPTSFIAVSDPVPRILSTVFGVIGAVFITVSISVGLVMIKKFI